MILFSSALRAEAVRRGRRLLHQGHPQEPHGAALLHEPRALLPQQEAVEPGRAGLQAGPREGPQSRQGSLLPGCVQCVNRCIKVYRVIVRCILFPQIIISQLLLLKTLVVRLERCNQRLPTVSPSQLLYLPCTGWDPATPHLLPYPSVVSPSPSLSLK